MSATLSFFVPGIPAPQGSKVRTKWGVREDNANTQPWRDSVMWAARDARLRDRMEIITDPVHLYLEFRFPHLKAHRRANGELKPNAPWIKQTSPDLDKLARAVCDAITGAGVWRDDALVAQLYCWKLYHNEPGVYVDITSTVRLPVAMAAS